MRRGIAMKALYLETDRLILRTFNEDDYGELVKWI